MPSKETIVMYARSIACNYKGVQADGTFPSWETLKAIYDEGMEVPRDWNVNNGANLTALKKGEWLRKQNPPGGTSDPSLGISWCGIFATYVLRGCGIPVKWRKGVGITPLPPHLQIMAGLSDADKIVPGDICVKGTNQHHFIVIGRSGDTLTSVDGNLSGQSVREGNTYNIPVLKREALKQMEYDKSLLGGVFPQKSKYSFYYYRLL